MAKLSAIARPIMKQTKTRRFGNTLNQKYKKAYSNALKATLRQYPIVGGVTAKKITMKPKKKVTTTLIGR